MPIDETLEAQTTVHMIIKQKLHHIVKLKSPFLK